MVSKLSAHVIVCGFGRVDRRASDELTQEGVPFIVVDKDPKRIRIQPRMTRCRP
jgi:voltage-gated potassium channel Kch